MSKPNVLLITTDQHWHGALGLGVRRDPCTPNLDRLARSGTVFRNAYCTQPLCVPSRTSMMTGKMPHATGYTVNHVSRHGALQGPMLGALMRDAGYDCGYVGKWHLPLTTEEGRIHGFDHLGWISHAASDAHTDPGIPAACRDFLRRPRKQPFFLVAAFTNPHDLCNWSQGKKLPNGPLPDPPPPDQCPALPDNFAESSDEPPVIREMQRLQPRQYPTADWDAGRWRQYRWAGYRLVEKVDALIAEILDELDRSGIFDETLIVFSADHGDGAGAHQWTQKQVLYEESIRVPLIVKPPRARRQAADHQALVSVGIDLMPTLCDYAGAATPVGIPGFSLRGLMENREPCDWRTHLVVETEFTGGFGETHGVTGRALRGKRFKYITYSRGNPNEQLFDLERDAGEMINLAVKPEYHELTVKYRRMLAGCNQ